MWIPWSLYFAELESWSDYRMAKKVFISYSHVDEQLKVSLEDHLAIMRRNEIISDWNDRKIIPGQDWANEISSNLEGSDITDIPQLI